MPARFHFQLNKEAAPKYAACLGLTHKGATTNKGKYRMNAEIEDYDQWTINYLRGVGVQGALLERVERLVQEVAHLKAQLAELQAAKAGA